MNHMTISYLYKNGQIIIIFNPSDQRKVNVHVDYYTHYNYSV